MTYEQLKERFSALLQQVEQAHDKCKLEEHTVLTLFETFYHVHFLGVAFMQDCQAYTTNQPNQLPPVDLMEIIAKINEALQCSIVHLHTSAERLNHSDLGKMNTHALLNKTIYKLLNPDKADPLN